VTYSNNVEGFTRSSKVPICKLNLDLPLVINDLVENIDYKVVSSSNPFFKGGSIHYIGDVIKICYEYKPNEPFDGWGREWLYLFTEDTPGNRITYFKSIKELEKALVDTVFTIDKSNALYKIKTMQNKIFILMASYSITEEDLQ
jgi:hypothetical protein